MKANQLATLVLRLLGIYCLVMFVPFAEVFNSTIFYAHSLGTFAYSTVAYAFMILVGWLAVGISLILGSKTLGRMLIPAEMEESGLKAITFEQAQALAFAVAGVLIFADALPTLLRNLFAVLHFLWQSQNVNPEPAFDRPYNRSELVTAISGLLKSALGLYLFFQAKGFANFWRSLRSWGTRKPPEN